MLSDNEDSDNENIVGCDVEHDLVREIRECEKTTQFFQDKNEFLENENTRKEEEIEKLRQVITK